MSDINGFSKSEVYSSFSSKILELIILPTEQCNFRCVYCYEDFSIGKMGAETIQGIKNLILKRVENLKVLSFSWFGGEPLLEQKIIFELLQFAKEQCDLHGVHFSGGFTTNGYKLNPTLLKKLVYYGQTGYQISLDGYKEEHDKTRVLRSGKETFNKIWQNLIDIRDSDISDVRIKLRIHLTPNNFSSVQKLVTEIKKEFGGDKRFNIHFHKVSQLGGTNDFKILEKSEYMNRITILNNMLNNSIESESEYTKRGGNNYICYASKPNSLLIRADGRIGKCTVALNSSSNDIGRIKPDGTVEIDNRKLRPWLGGFEEMDVGYLGCPVTKVHKYKFDDSIEIREIN